MIPYVFNAPGTCPGVGLGFKILDMKSFSTHNRIIFAVSTQKTTSSLYFGVAGLI